MDDVINRFRDDYINLLKNSFSINNLKKCHEIVLPFFDSRNDALVVYLEKKGTVYFVTDDSYIINNLIDAGIQLTQTRKRSIERICNNLGVKLERNELMIEAAQNDLATKTHNLVQAMLRIDDLYLTSQDRVVSYFIEDLTNFFDKNEIYYTSDVSFIGKSGLTQSFDFMFQRTKNNPERVCTALNSLDKKKMTSVLFAWLDIESKRGPDTKMMVIVNDENKVDHDALTGFSSYGVQPFLFSELENNTKAFM